MLVAGVVLGLVAGPVSSLAASGVDATIVSGGLSRSYTFYKPPGIAGTVPLVIVMHGTPATGRTMESLTGMDALADQRSFEVAFPNSQGAGTNTGVWDVGCCNAQFESSDDVQFISDLIDRLVATQSADPSRVYVVGFSLGGAMTYRLGCQLSSKVAAIGSAAGFEYLSTPCAPDRPVSMYQIHGTADYYNGSCGGQTTSNTGCGFGDPGYEPKVHDTYLEWRSLDGCPGAPPAGQTTGVRTVENSTGCTGGSAVRLDSLANGGHCYPQTNTCGNFAASVAFLDFFAGHTLSPAPASPTTPPPGQPPPGQPPSAPPTTTPPPGQPPPGQPSSAPPTITKSSPITTPTLAVKLVKAALSRRSLAVTLTLPRAAQVWVSIRHGQTTVARTQTTSVPKGTSRLRFRIPLILGHGTYTAVVVASAANRQSSAKLALRV